MVVDLQGALQPVAEELGRVEDMVARTLDPGKAVDLQGMLAHVAGYRGKRLRPAQVLLAGQATGHLVADHISVAAVVEMIHTATLVHDDVLDDAVVRRHLPALHRLHGVEASVLLGDYIYAAAFQAATDLPDQTCSQVLARITREVCRGEITQVLNRGRVDLGERDYFGIIGAKTASLYGAACELGAHYAGADGMVAQKLRAYGYALGTAFQIVDDCLDMAGREERVGKTLGSDIAKGKMTLPLILLYAEADGAGKEEMVRIFSGLEPAARREALAERFDLDRGMARAQARAADLAREALAALAGLPPGAALDSLRALADYVLHRDR